MTITKPFTFAAGTKARANEVNTDFDVLYAQVNANISDIASLSNEISGFDLTKADVNGSALNTFAVKDPVNSSDAVNKGYMESHAVMLTGAQTITGTKTFSAIPKLSGTSSTAGSVVGLARNSTAQQVQLTDGTLIQCGSSSLDGGSHYKYVNLPYRYNTAGSYEVVICDAGSAASIINKKVIAKDDYRFRVYSESSSAGDAWFWIAMGKGPTS